MNNQTPSPTPIQQVLDQFIDCDDLIRRTYPLIHTDVIYFGNLIDAKLLDQQVLEPLHNIKPEEVPFLFHQSPFVQEIDLAKVIEGVAGGNVAIFHHGLVFLVHVYGPAQRSVTPSETEFVISGPHDAFVESIETNLSLIRKRLRSPRLKAVELHVGEAMRNTVYVLFLDGVADPDIVNEMVNRITDIEIDGLLNADLLVQCIDDNPDSIFPQFLTTERPDLVASKLLEGKVCCLMDNSPIAITAPTNFFEFFSSPDDYYQRWALGSGVRILRFVAFIITISFTALYVAVTTFHYEMIPYALLLNLTESREKVPFPPLFEALLMEITIELLREAGARLPAKIGQTIGIVGGIVIGQAAVQAGLTSNTLIIAVASSAIASFVIPSYIMSASIRMVRFGLILLAGVWGMFGLIIGISLIVIHLSGLKNLETSYLTPVAPMNLSDWKDTFIRGPLRSLMKRPSQTRSKNTIRNNMRK